MMNVQIIIRRRGMKRLNFEQKYQGRIKGIISGLDRILFRGTLRFLSYTKGMEIFMTRQGVWHKTFGAFAEKLSNQIKTHAEAIAKTKGRPYRYIESSKVSKEEMAQKIMQEDGITEGLICVLSCVEPCMSYGIRRDRDGKRLVLARQLRKCLYLYFYFIDREFGFMHVRLQTWMPFAMQACLNGREYLARRMDRAGIGYKRQDNCFTYIEDMAKAQRIMDDLDERKWVRVLDAWARRINPLLDRRTGLKLNGYYWSVRQSEYATDVLFRDAASLQAVYPKLLDHAITQFGSEDVLRFLGRRTNIRFNGQVKSKLEQRHEGTRVKHWVEENSIKMYSKEGSVLRIETTINDPTHFMVRREVIRKGRRVYAWVPMRKGVVDLRRRVDISCAANMRYIEALSVVGNTMPSHQVLDPISRRLVRDGRSYRPLRPISPDEAKVFSAIMRGEFLVRGFTNKDLRKHLIPGTDKDPDLDRKASSRIGRIIRLLREHGLIYKVLRTHYYRTSKRGHNIMSTAIKFRESDIALLAA